MSVLADLDISDAWIRNLPPTVPVRAGYMKLFNPESTAKSIISISSDEFANIEIHQTIELDGMARMEQIPVLTIGTNEQLKLEPGGMHLMMMQPNEPGKPGDKIKITIRFSDGSQQSLMMTVKN